MNLLQRALSLPKRVGVDAFMAGIVLAIVLAKLAPSVGISGRYATLEDAASWGVSLIFFFYGLRLSPAKLKAGLSNWRLHLVVQAATFLFFPVLGLLAKPFLAGTAAEPFWQGTFFLCILPSTVSSSVVMVSLAGGNIPAAIFNASVSSLIGIFMTPLWAGLFLAADTGGFDAAQVALKLVVQVIVPVALGLLLNGRWGSFAERHKKALKRSDQTVILLIVYTAFCKSFSAKVFDGYSPWAILFLGAAMAALFFFVMGAMALCGRLLGFNREDSTTALFCGSKKSLVHGSVMVKVLFPHNPATGVLLLPLMLYHALQIVIASVLARKIAAGQQSSKY